MERNGGKRTHQGTKTARTVPRTVRARCPGQLNGLGQSGRFRLRAGLADLQPQFGNGPALSPVDFQRASFDIRAANQAQAVLQADFPSPLDELCGTLLAVRVADYEQGVDDLVGFSLNSATHAAVSPVGLQAPAIDRRPYRTNPAGTSIPFSL